MRRALGRVGLLQVDSVNVVCRSHYLPLFSRIGPYPRELVDAMAGHGAARLPRRSRRELFEYWAHEASLLPFAAQPLLRWRMARAGTDAWGSMVRIAREDPGLVERVFALVRDRGPIRASETGFARPAPRPGHMWNWHAGKVALEYLFFAGRVASAGRVNFERLYDLPERVLPAEVLAAPDPDRADAQRELVRIAARALGVAAEPDLGDYFRLPRADSRARTAELVESGELIPVAVEGWGAPAHLWHEARRPRAVAVRALLSPFDSLIWFRARAEQAFGLRYRIEIYTPAHRRVHGYYVLPFLHGERFTARVDLKADRAAGALLVRGAHAEAGAAGDAETAHALAAELHAMARWLGLHEVRIAPNGDLAAALSAAVAAA